MTDITKQLQSAEAGPRRIQLKRTKGWRMPDNTVSVARPTKWGNPFSIKIAREIGLDWYTADWAVKDFRDWLNGDREQWAGPESEAAWKAISDNLEKELRGKNLACWCKPGEPCHADVLLELANAPLLSAAAVEGSDA